LAGAAVNYQSRFRRVTPLHCAVVHQNEGLVKLLLDNGAAVNATDIFGKTPLDHAVRRKNKNAADLICRAGGKSSKDIRLAQNEARKLSNTISFICKNCKKVLTVSAKFGGRSGTCNHCGAMMRVPYILPRLATLLKTRVSNGLAFVLGIGALCVGSVLTAAFRQQMNIGDSPPQTTSAYHDIVEPALTTRSLDSTLEQELGSDEATRLVTQASSLGNLDEVTAKLENKSVDWDGVVRDVEAIGKSKYLVLDLKLDNDLGKHATAEVSFRVTDFDAVILPAGKRLTFQGKIGSVTALQDSCRFHLIDVTYSRAARPTPRDVPLNSPPPLGAERDRLELEQAQTRLTYAENAADERFKGVNRFTNDDYVQAQTLKFLAKRASRSTYVTGDYESAILKVEEAIAAYEKAKP